jgi:rSAM/selenodomain-associated transferase 2
MISIVIPTLNEENNIRKLVPYLQNSCVGKPIEIIIADGGSTDDTLAIAASLGAKNISSNKGRSIQMNTGAKLAQYEILYFIHADTLPPAGFYTDIITAVNNGYEAGRYRTKFESNKWLLKLNAFFTRFDLFVCYGGDQTLYTTTALFKKLNGYNEKMLIMEEYDFVERAKKIATYKIFKNATLVSARKYETNTWWQVQKINYKIVHQYKKGVPQSELVKMYRSMLKNLK